MKDSSMKQTKLHPFRKLSSNGRFLFEIGASILLAFIVFFSLSQRGGMEDGEKDLWEIERSLDDLQTSRAFIGQNDPNERILREMEIVKLRMEVIAFHDLWLEGLVRNQRLPSKELKELRKKIELMKGEEENRLELLKEIQVLRRVVGHLTQEIKREGNSESSFEEFEKGDFFEESFVDEFEEAFDDFNP